MGFPERLLNFQPGPAALYKDVLDKISGDLLNYNSTGVSILELTHRSKDFQELERTASGLMREVYQIPDDYEVLWIPGGATAIFAAVVYNLVRKKDSVLDYIVTGVWSELAVEEAKKLGANVNIVYNTKGTNHNGDIDLNNLKFSPNAAFVYYCENETVHGVELLPAGIPGKESWAKQVPDGVPIVCDMSSNIMSRKVDISKYGVIFAGAQKNIGTSGVTLVIIKKSLFNTGTSERFYNVPTTLNFSICAGARSAYNTPPVFQIYVTKLTLSHVKSIGGITKVEEDNAKKFAIINEIIGSSKGYYLCNVKEEYRSRMNVVFRICPKGDKVPCPESEESFVNEARECGIIGLKGHRKVGGLRISLYNAVPIDHTKKLADYMKNFQLKHSI